MERNDFVWWHKEIKPDQEEKDKMIAILDRQREQARQGIIRLGTVIRKTYLDRHDSIVVEFKKQRISMGLVNIKVNKDENTMKGTRVLMCQGKYMFQEVTIPLDRYRKNWRAWDGSPDYSRPWRGRP